ncbi:MAG: glycosyltransferase family 2 protein [Deltaproteobacteria bacterium]|nr:glycosyltransferase family 2 protein [Deltaproteobacteria bacterium]
MLRASVIIVEYNTLRHLGRCLSSLGQMAMPAEEYEVIVVDNGSPTPARPLVGGFPRVRLVETGRNLGFAGGNCAALPSCNADVVVALNPDTEVEPGWLAAMLRPFADPGVGIVGCKIYYPSTRILQHAGGIVLPCGRSEHRGRGERDVGQYDRQVDVPYVCGASLAVRRSVIERIGFFSTAYHPAYYEDTELCLRAWQAGYRVVFAPDAVVFHHEWAASEADALGSFRLSEVSRIRYIMRNYRLRDVVTRFLPEELAFQLAGDRFPTERRIAALAYLKGALTSRGGAHR